MRTCNTIASGSRAYGRVSLARGMVAARPQHRCAAVVDTSNEQSAEAPEALAEDAAAGPVAAGPVPPRPAEAAGNAEVVRPPSIPVADTICMQGFGWDSCKGGDWYAQVQAKIPELVAANITHIWLPPPSQSVAPQGYLPGQLYNLDSKYGNQQELVALTKALLEAGIRPVADIVINHRCADKQDEDGTWNKYGDDVTHDGKRINWDTWAITCDDPVFNGSGSKDSGDDYEAAPDLDHHNEELRDSLVDWLNWLATDIGFMSWRFDFARGFAPEYCKEYMTRTLGGGKDIFHVAEDYSELKWNGDMLDYNQDAARQKLVDYVEVAEHTTMFDFPMKGILQEAVKHTQYDRLSDERGKAPGLVGWWPEKACLFVDNHDTGSTQQHWPFPSEHVMLGYAYILTHPGVPCLLWEHYYDWGLGSQIDELVSLRLRASVRADSKLEILCAESDMYVARCGDNVTIKLGPRMDMGDLKPDKGEGWRRVQSGKDYAVWEKKAPGEAGEEESSVDETDGEGEPAGEAKAEAEA